jgi:hypothetical protein
MSDIFLSLVIAYDGLTFFIIKIFLNQIGMTNILDSRYLNLTVSEIQSKMDLVNMLTQGI